MPFEGFLNDTRARPVGLRWLGYAASLALHGPPLGIFCAAWLTRALVLDHALDLPDYNRTRAVYYEVPVQMVNGIPGMDAGAQTTGTRGIAGGNLGGPRGKSGIGKRRSRRPLEFPLAQRRIRRAALQAKPVALGPEEFASDDGLAWDADGVGRAIVSHATGPGTGDDGEGSGNGGDPRAASGNGAGQKGRGAAVGDGQGTGSEQARMAMWVPPEPRQKENARLRKSRGAADEGEEIEDGGGVDDTSVVGPPLPGRAPRVSMNYAAYLRTYEPFPTLPDSCWPPGRTTNTVLLEICVSERGEVADVVVRESAGDEVDAYLTAAARTWRYRPRMVQGTPRPFCHPIRLVYTRALRFDQRW